MSRSSDEVLAQAAEHFAAQHYEQAMDAYRAALEADPGRYEAHIGIAYCAIAQGEGEDAIDALVERGRTFATSGSSEPAFAMFGAAIELAPERLELHVDVAELEAKQGWIKAASVRLQQLAEAYEEDGLREEAVAVREVLEGLTKKPARTAPPPPPRHKLTRTTTPAPARDPIMRPVVFRDTAPLPIRRRDTARLTILQPATLAKAMRANESKPKKVVRHDTAPLLLLQPYRFTPSPRRSRREPPPFPSLLRAATTVGLAESSPMQPLPDVPLTRIENIPLNHPFAAIEAKRESVLKTAVKTITDARGRQRIAVMPAPAPNGAAERDAAERDTNERDTARFFAAPPPAQRHEAPSLTGDAARTSSAQPLTSSTHQAPSPPVISTMPRSPLTDRLRQRAAGLRTSSADALRTPPRDPEGDDGAVDGSVV